MILRHVVECHEPKCILDVFLEFLECLALSHDLGMFEEFPEPESIMLSIDHCEFSVHIATDAAPLRDSLLSPRAVRRLQSFLILVL